MRPAGSGREDSGLPRPRADAAPRRPVRGKWSVTAWTGPLLTAAVLGSAMILAPLPPPLSGVGHVAFAQNDDGPGTGEGGEIGKASCRERVCPYVTTSGVAVSVKKKKT